MFRLVNPDRELRIAGGRELHLGSLQALGLYAANSIFVGDYLTTKGQPAEADYQMIRDLGFEIVRNPEVLALLAVRCICTRRERHSRSSSPSLASCPVQLTGKLLCESVKSTQPAEPISTDSRNPERASAPARCNSTSRGAGSRQPFTPDGKDAIMIRRWLVSCSALLMGTSLAAAAVAQAPTSLAERIKQLRRDWTAGRRRARSRRRPSEYDAGRTAARRLRAAASRVDGRPRRTAADRAALADAEQSCSAATAAIRYGTASQTNTRQAAAASLVAVAADREQPTHRRASRRRSCGAERTTPTLLDCPPLAAATAARRCRIRNVCTTN